MVRLSAIGDTCHALAVIRNLQDNWPQTAITWIIGKSEAALHAGVDGVEFITFDKSSGSAAYRELGQALTGRRFDAALCMHASWRVNRLIRLLPSPIKLGFDFRRARDFQWLFTNARIPPAAREHSLEGMPTARLPGSTAAIRRSSSARVPASAAATIVTGMSSVSPRWLATRKPGSAAGC